MFLINLGFSTYRRVLARFGINTSIMPILWAHITGQISIKIPLMPDLRLNVLSPEGSSRMCKCVNIY